MSAGGGKTRPADFSQTDRAFMERALNLAKKAELAGEVPVGAVLVQESRVIGEGWNAPIARADPTSHAEIAAMRAAAILLGNYRLPGTTLFCTLEPCIMCAGAINIARVERLVFAARDLRFGAIRSKFSLVDSPLLNHQVEVDEGLFAAEAGDLLAQFFRRCRTSENLAP